MKTSRATRRPQGGIVWIAALASCGLGAAPVLANQAPRDRGSDSAARSDSPPSETPPPETPPRDEIPGRRQADDTAPLPPTPAPPSERRAPDSKVPNGDRVVIQKLHDINQTEIQLGALANNRGWDKQTRVLALKLVSDHKLADDKLDAYLRKHGSTLSALSTSPLDADHVLVATWNGRDFDREFNLRLVSDQTKAIDIIQDALTDTADENLQALYRELLPALQAHKRAGQQILTGLAR